MQPSSFLSVGEITADLGRDVLDGPRSEKPRAVWAGFENHRGLDHRESYSIVRDAAVQTVAGGDGEDHAIPQLFVRI